VDWRRLFSAWCGATAPAQRKNFARQQAERPVTNGSDASDTTPTAKRHLRFESDDHCELNYESVIDKLESF
jgi:hypothetical protein